MRRRFAMTALVVVLVLVVGGAVAACGGGGSAEARPTTGRAIYKANCATCHGADGQGFVGPALAGLMVDKYPNVDDQIAVVTDGRRSMPSFGGRLTAAEIRK